MQTTPALGTLSVHFKDRIFYLLNSTFRRRQATLDAARQMLLRIERQTTGLIS